MGAASQPVSSFDCGRTSVSGPNGYFWCPYAEATGTATFDSVPTSTELSFFAQSPADVRAGVSFQLYPDGRVVDLSKFGGVTLGLDVAEGDGFELFLGNGPELGCSYVLPKSASGSYSVQLRNAAWCIPSQCGFDLGATGGLILASVPTASTLRAKVRSIDFITTGMTSGTASAMSAGFGPGGLCWFVVLWNSGGLANWAGGPVTSSSAHITAHSAGNAVAGMAFEIPTNIRLSQYRQIQLTAVVSTTIASNSFLLQGVNKDRGLIWRFIPQSGSANYVVNLQQSDGSFTSSGSVLGLDEIQRFELVSPVGETGDLDAQVTSIAFVK